LAAFAGQSSHHQLQHPFLPTLANQGLVPVAPGLSNLVALNQTMQPNFAQSRKRPFSLVDHQSELMLASQQEQLLLAAAVFI